MATDAVEPAEAQAFYEDFSLAVGQRDWMLPNLRHEQLKLLIRALLGRRRGLRIADVGCGAGVMTDFLTRYGDVVGIDFSTAAIAAARRYARRPTFIAGGLEALPPGRYDLITLFDVVEHIPAGDRRALIADLSQRLDDKGLLFCSTPFPMATRHKRNNGDPALQIIDEEVDLAAVLSEAAAVGLQLIRFETYDVWQGSPEYQAFVFAPRRPFGGHPILRTRELWTRERINNVPATRGLRRLWLAVRCLRRGDTATAAEFLRGRYPRVRS